MYSPFPLQRKPLEFPSICHRFEVKLKELAAAETCQLNKTSAGCEDMETVEFAFAVSMSAQGVLYIYFFLPLDIVSKIMFQLFISPP